MTTAAEPRRLGGRYGVLGELGRGGMGVVYRVRDSSTSEVLALKQLLLPDTPARARAAEALFEREFHVLAQLTHPRVIAVFDYGHDAAGPFYTMELLDGVDLRALAPLDVSRACALTFDVCSSLALLHARRLVHRDISPRNIHCTGDGHAKLIDFGAMVPMGPCSNIVGTPAFIAPEVVHHGELDARTDLYSLGATLYYALTGRAPFPVRQLSELRAQWREALVPPSEWVPGIPPGLDALCGALLRIDPAQRPASAYEVIQRLQTITGIAPDEQPEDERAFLQTPAFVGREPLLRRFRQGARRALHGAGSAFWFEGEAGVGRSRLLHACALEAKTLGAIALHAGAGASARAPLAAAQRLSEQLVQYLPEVAFAAAQRAGVESLLFEGDASAAKLRDLTARGIERAAVQSALSAWLAQVCESYALSIAVDDVHDVDEPSIALLAALALEARNLRLTLAVSAESEQSASVPSAFSALRGKCTVLSLPPLDEEESYVLVASVFGSQVNVRLLANRLFNLGAGKPRDMLTLAEHLIETGVLSYEHGRWSIPADLDAAALPASSSEALAIRVHALSPLARRLAEAQALLGSGLRRQDYAVLAGEADAATLNDAIMSLVQRRILQSDGDVYRMSHRALGDSLCAQLDPAQRRERHLALYQLYLERSDRNPYLLLHHLLEAERYDEAFGLFGRFEAFSDTAQLDAILRVGAERMIQTLEAALAVSLRIDRPRRETQQIRRLLCVMSTRGDERVYRRVSPLWLAQLELDSGLAAYRALDPALPRPARLQAALAAAAARYDATPERERVHTVKEAIGTLGSYVACSIVVGARARDFALLATLPGLLEPFTSVSPLVEALWHNAKATHERYTGRIIQARERWRDVYERLGKIPPETATYVSDTRRAAARGVAAAELLVGSAAALEWAAKFDADPVQRVDAMYFRRLDRLMHDDAVGAEYFGEQVELLTLRSSARPYFVPLWSAELQIACALRDLPGIKRVLEAFRPLALRYLSWRGLFVVTQGEFERLRGDLVAAADAFERALGEAWPDAGGEPVCVETWAYAVTGSMAVAIERGEFERARAFGHEALGRCERRDVEAHWFPIAQRLAVAEAGLGQLTAAAGRLDRLIELQRKLGVRGVFLAESYVTRTRIAVSAGETAVAAQYAALARAEPAGAKLLAQAAQHEPQFAAAARRSIDLAPAPTQFEVSVLGVAKPSRPNPEVAQLRAALDACANAEARALRAVQSICELTQAEAGDLYLAGAEGQLNLAAQHNTSHPDADVVRFVRGFFAQQVDDDEITSAWTHATHMLSLPGAAAYRDGRGRELQLFMLSCKRRRDVEYVGLAVLHVGASAKPMPHLPGLLTALAEALLPAR